MLVIAAMLALAAVVILFLPAVRSRLLPKPDMSALRVESLAELGSQGAPLAGELLVPSGDGYPTGDGRALFWLSLRGTATDGTEWLLLRLPDRRVLARAHGFHAVKWLVGGTALAVVASETPFCKWPVLWRYVDHFRYECWTIDWRTGAVKPLDLADLPAGQRPAFLNTRVAPTRGPVHWSLGDATVAMPPVPEARHVGDQELLCDWNYETTTETFSLKGADPGTSRTLCTLPNCRYPVSAVCVADKDSAVFLVPVDLSPGSNLCEAWWLTISTGQLERLPLPLELPGVRGAKP